MEEQPNVDIIILSYTKDKNIFDMTTRCINTIKSQTGINCNIIVVETNKHFVEDGFTYNATVILPGEEFNYNRFLNIGLKYCTAPYILITNNDVIFYKNSIMNLVEALKTTDLISVSPIDLYYNKHAAFLNHEISLIEGTKVGVHLTGWCFMVKNEIFNIIGKFDEQFSFWYQDNDYCNLLNKYKLKHALVANAAVCHFGGQSHHLIEVDKFYDKTNGSEAILNAKWK